MSRLPFNPSGHSWGDDVGYQLVQERDAQRHEYTGKHDIA